MTIEQRLREAAGEEMKRVRQEDLRPLELPRRKAHQSLRWLAPAIVMVAVAVVAVSFTHLPGRGPGPRPLSGGDAPPYFVTLPTATSATGATVHDAATGKKIAEIKSDGVHYSQVVAAGDQRTFFLAAEAPGCTVRIDRVRLADDGTVASRSTVPGHFKADIKFGIMAVSADGKRLAVSTIPSSSLPFECAPNTINVVDTTSGRYRTWGLPPGSAFPISNSSTRWGADGRTLYFLAPFKNGSYLLAPSNEYPPRAVLALDTRAKGTSLTAAQVVTNAQWGATVATDILRVSPDGRKLTVIACEKVGNDCVRHALWEISSPAGHPAHMITPMPPEFGLISSDATGRHMLALLHIGEEKNVLMRIDDGNAYRLQRDGENPGWSAW